jgi:hypothetical protein
MAILPYIWFTYPRKDCRVKGVWVKAREPITQQEFQILACSRGKEAELSYNDKKIIAEFISYIVLNRARPMNDTDDEAKRNQPKDRT